MIGRNNPQQAEKNIENGNATDTQIIVKFVITPEFHKTLRALPKRDDGYVSNGQDDHQTKA
jgi:hypothetical protein